jgi:hypothetical protein
MSGQAPHLGLEPTSEPHAHVWRRRDSPGDVEQILEWAKYPLATAEIPELRGIGIEDAREELERAGARFEAVAGDGYWSPR